MDTAAVLQAYSNLEADQISLTVLAWTLFALMPLAYAGGHWAGRRTLRRREASGKTGPPPVGDATLGAMLALLGLLLAFTYAFALSRADERRQAITEEAAAIGTAFLRAELAAGSEGEALRQALLAYAKTRIVPPGALRSERRLLKMLGRSIEAQAQLWPLTLAAARSADVPPPVATLIVNGVTEVLDAHTRRIVGASERIPRAVLFLMLAAAAASLAVAGNLAALRGRPVSWRAITFSLMLATVIFVILDFERPYSGFIRLNDDALRFAIADMETALPPEGGGG